MTGSTKPAPRHFAFVPPAEQNVDAWRALLGLDRGRQPLRWTVNTEVRVTATPDRSPHPLVGANADVWKQVIAVRGDSAAMDHARIRQADAAGEADIEQL